MKTTIFALAVVAAMCLISTPARAEETTTATNVEPTKTRFVQPSPSTEKREEKREKAITTMKVATEKRSEALAKECARVAENATTLIGKIQERIDRAKIEGRDVQKAIDALVKAKADLASGKSLCDQAVAKFDTIPTDTKENTSAAFTEARQLARQTKEKFMQMRKDLAEAVKAIKGIGTGRPTPSVKPEPSSEN